MVKAGFDKFFWGFLFIMLDFRIQGVDITPNVIGFILFAIGFQTLAEHSPHFAKAKPFNLIMIFVSIFSLYQPPASAGGGVHIDLFGLAVGLVSFVLTLIAVYHLFMGIKDMASKRQRLDIENEAAQKWMYYLVFQIAAMCNIVLAFIPPLFVVVVIALFIAGIVLTVILMLFMKKCGEQL